MGREAEVVASRVVVSEIVISRVFFSGVLTNVSLSLGNAYDGTNIKYKEKIVVTVILVMIMITTIITII